MKLLRITSLCVLALVILAGLGVWLFVDMLTVSKSELLVTPDGVTYAKPNKFLDRYIERCRPEPELPQLTHETVIQSGYLRNFYVYTPSRVIEPAAAIIVLHGSGGSAQQVYDLLGTSFYQLSEREGIAVIYAEGLGGGWNDLRTKSPHIAKELNLDDVGYIATVLDWAQQNLGTKRDNSFFFGMSNGAQMIIRLLVEVPELVTAAAMIGGALPQNPDFYGHYNHLTPRPVMFVNGTADNVVPYQGGAVKILKMFDFGRVFSAEKTVQYWVEAAELGRPPSVHHIDTVDDGTSIDLRIWSEPSKPEVRAYRVNGGKHTIPMPLTGGACDDLLSTSHDMNTVEQAWSFFQSSANLTFSGIDKNLLN
jgi:polyhydroxybutyrate depolymerase